MSNFIVFITLNDDDSFAIDSFIVHSFNAVCLRFVSVVIASQKYLLIIIMIHNDEQERGT